MSDITKTYTKEQYYEMGKNYIIAQSVGLTNFNKGSDTRAIIETVGDIASMLGLDFLEALRQSIPILLYKPFNFERGDAISSSGALRYYRRPVFYISYSGADGSVTLDITGTHLTLTTSGTPGDDLSVAFATFTTITAVVAEIDSQSNWSATAVIDGDVSDLYLYSSKQFIGNTNYLLLSNTIDVMYTAGTLATILASTQASVDSKVFYTTVGGTIPAGDATSAALAAISIQKGLTSNIDAAAIDTINGNGALTTFIAGVEHVINDLAFANGADAETSEERAARFMVHINGLHGGTKLGIENDILAIDGIKGVTLRERFPKDGINTIVADDGTGNLSAALIVEIDKVIIGDFSDFTNYPGKGVAGIKYNIEAPSQVVIDVTAVITRIGNTSDDAEMISATKTNIENYINTLKLGGDVVDSEIIALGKKSHPATYDFDISALQKNGSPVAIDNISIGDSEVARTGTGTTGLVVITVNTLSVLP